MIDSLSTLPPLLQAFLATCFTWFVTALGAAVVFATKRVNRKMLDGMLGFAAGVMIAASYWSLLAPAIEMSWGEALPAWFPAAAGFLLGAGFLWLFDKVLPTCTWVFPEKRRKGSALPGDGPPYSSWLLPCTTFRKGWQLEFPSGRLEAINRM